MFEATVAAESTAEKRIEPTGFMTAPRMRGHARPEASR
jgi:hypothetical protein